MQAICHAVVQAPEGRIRIEGTQAFVQTELARYAQPEFEIITTAPEPVTLASPAIDFTHLTELPGDNMAQKTVNAALLMSYSDLSQGIQKTPLWRIRDIVKQLHCHDTNNFSAILRRETALFSHSGEPTLALNAQGMERAAHLAQQLQLV
ncbi:hypothetical protein [Actimicrobium sp. CCI2.3]|uniref:hypothetical protein n=1 Tax=Actimicrobium sp. CCI2.3 TaxID=3048616 RepID=UPI002AB33179|nr:hypothetical protein [Actimicrobium sp. CCI2.3]MDY7576507.1 hypothetical protein [Actimicrobium sp. CCI2.3]MEB0021515.1 hypothetical protein [Actimicrobium sp. CCI2.3]